jgi:cysteinyl-tRNA synthetase
MIAVNTRLFAVFSVVVVIGLIACNTDDEPDDSTTDISAPPTARVAASDDQSQTVEGIYWLSDIDLATIASLRPAIVVIDYSLDGSEDTEFTESEIDSLRSGMSGDVLIISYMSIGEAEDYLYYWRDSWRLDLPGWLEAQNPNWLGNFKGRLWEPEWQAQIFGTPESYLDRIIAAGFDGVYLDIIDAYDYFSERGRGSVEDEMVAFVVSLSEYVKARRPRFLIFPQNVPELGERADYLVVVDGVGMEGVYFGWDEPNVATKPADTEWLNEQLARFVEAGETVLAGDYASKDGDVAEAYRRAREQGYRSTVTHVDLDRLPSSSP